MNATQRRQLKRARRRAEEQRSAMILASAKRAGDFPSGILTFASGPETRCEWFEAAAEGEGGAKLKKFSGVAYTGGAMKVGFGRPVVIDLAGLSAGSDVIPFLKDHNSGDIVGHGSAEIGKRQIKIAGVLSGVGAGAQEVEALAGRGFAWQLSVGVEPTKVDFLDAGDSALVNGRTVVGPAYVVRAGSLREVSFVAIGADGRTSSAVAAQLGKGSIMGFEAWVEAKGFKVAELSAEQLDVLRAAYDAENAPSGDPVKGASKPEATAPAVDVNAVVQAAVDKVLATVNDRNAVEGVFANFSGKVEATKVAEIRAKANAEKWNAERVELELRRESRPSAPAIHAGDSGEINASAVEVGLLRCAGVNSSFVEKQYSPEVLAAADGRRYARMTLHKALGLLCHAAGVYAPLGDKEGLVAAAFEAHKKLLTFDAFSTLSLSGILGNTANKAMLAAYAGVNTTWQKIAAVRSHSDFKINTLYRLDADGAFMKVGASGDLKLSTLQETSYTKQLATYGTMIALTRRDMVNDDMGAFLQIVTTLGRLGALRIEEAVYVSLLAGINSTSLFHANNGNYLTGAGALSISTLASLAQKFDDQVDANDKPILVQPKTLLVGSAIKTTAQNLYNETVVVATTTANAPLPAKNPHAGLYEPVVSPFVNNTRIKDQDGAAISGQTSTGFGLFCDPNDRAALGVAFLNGAQTPTIQSAEMDFAQLGMQWRGFIDFGVGYEDPAAAAWSTGT